MLDLEKCYMLGVGTTNVDRLQLLNEHYNPSSRALLEMVGVRSGGRVADIGCGHGAMSAWLAERVGPTGKVYAVDSSREQIELAGQRIAHLPQVELVCARVEDLPAQLGALDLVYSRFLLLHLPDPLAAIRAMAGLLRDEGQLVLEVPDIEALRFVPGEQASDLWRRWWMRLGEVSGASYDVAGQAADLLVAAGLSIQRRDRYQPVSARQEAKLLHALGFQQLIGAYIGRAGAAPHEIEEHLAFLRRVIPDPKVTVELYSITQYVATRTAAA